jgi:hypothetical protein
MEMRATVQSWLLATTTTEDTVMGLTRILRASARAHPAIQSAALLCALYFISWHLIAYWSNIPGSLLL